MRSPVRVTVRMALGLGVLVAAAGCTQWDPLTWEERGPCEDEVDVDLEGLDVRCEGDEGVFADLIFVSRDGRPTGDGTPDDPMSIPDLALTRAQREGRAWVLFAAGDYPGPLTLVDGVSLAGGYDPETWQRSPDTPTRFTAPRSPVVVARDLTQPIVVQDLHVEAPDATTPSAPSIALHVVDSGDALTWRRGSLLAGRGADAEEPPPWEEDAPGGEMGDSKRVGCGWQDSTQTMACDDGETQYVPGAEAVACPTGGHSGAGGAAGRPDWHLSDPSQVVPEPGEPGEPASSGATGGDGGRSAGVAEYRRIDGTCEVLTGITATPGQNGQRGEDGPPGRAAHPLGELDDRDLWQAARGETGEPGTHGGGGGGGGGGPTVYDLEDNCISWINPVYMYAPGGSGGSGGCGGQSGEGGFSGGGSFSALVVRSRLSLAQVPLTTAGGGDGASGQPGQRGGARGLRGSSWIDNQRPFLRSRVGGHGGHGGAGGDGAGGSSIGVLLFDGEVDLDDVTFNLGPSGEPPDDSEAPPGQREEVVHVDAPDR